MLSVVPQREVIALWAKWYEVRGTLAAYDWFRPKAERKLWPRFVWKDFVPQKYSFTTWQDVKGRLETKATKDMLGYMDMDQNCPLCKSNIEPAYHHFLKCNKTREVWTAIKGWLGLRVTINTIPSAIKWMTKKKASVVIRKTRRLALMTVVSLTWRTQNSLVHEGTSFEPKHIIFEVKKLAYATLYTIYPHDYVQMYLGV
ncbi:uncharacterized protein LOC121752811 [Salvia splendens]|uniref:uncharacterized protein LOC121752811 n=1 Tax=Salvia splendens TaxID=180675 RepID=UPI001C261A89|nr:uncharacterized protein LOC121752811 [Salvia splendens]